MTTQNIFQHLQEASGLLGKEIEKIFIPDGEQYKTLATAQVVFETLLNQHVDKKSCLIALGGGVIGDMTGFVASCYYRGISYCQVPTTFLAMIDASIGGKTGVNLGSKNIVGTLYAPEAVFTDINFLKTLPVREYRSGLAEVIKYALLNKDAHFLDTLTSQPQPGDWTEAFLLSVIKTCCELKIKVVMEDEQDTGARRFLNLGHTFGHAIEAALGFGTWLHGEAVSVGVLMALYMSVLLNFLPEKIWVRTEKLIKAWGLPAKLPESLDEKAFYAHLMQDKKSERGRLNFVLLKDFGQAFVTQDVTLECVEKVFKHFAS